jgi:hypothetical protein
VATQILCSKLKLHHDITRHQAPGHMKYVVTSKNHREDHIGSDMDISGSEDEEVGNRATEDKQDEEMDESEFDEPRDDDYNPGSEIEDNDADEDMDDEDFALGEDINLDAFSVDASQKVEKAGVVHLVHGWIQQSQVKKVTKHLGHVQAICIDLKL